MLHLSTVRALNRSFEEYAFSFTRQFNAFAEYLAIIKKKKKKYKKCPFKQLLKIVDALNANLKARVVSTLQKISTIFPFFSRALSPPARVKNRRDLLNGKVCRGRRNICAAIGQESSDEKPTAGCVIIADKLYSWLCIYPGGGPTLIGV